MPNGTPAARNPGPCCPSRQRSAGYRGRRSSPPGADGQMQDGRQLVRRGRVRPGGNARVRAPA